MSDPQELVVSREALRAELGQLEIRLIDRIQTVVDKKADASVVDQMEARIGSLEISRANREHLDQEVREVERRVTTLERFRYSVPSVALLSLLVALGTLVYYVTHG